MIGRITAKLFNSKNQPIVKPAENGQIKDSVDIDGHQKGKVLVQLDAVSYEVLKEGIARGDAPNIKALLEKHGYVLKPYLCGLPAITASIQAQLFYGIALPSYSWYDKETKTEINANKELITQTGLIENGSTYCSYFTGGAKDTAFIGLDNFKQNFNLEEIKRDFKLFKRAAKEQNISLPKLAYSLWKDMKDYKNKIKEQGGLRTFADRLNPLYMSIIKNVAYPLVYQGVKDSLEKSAPVIYADLLLYDNTAHALEPQSEDAFKALKETDKLVGRLKEAVDQADKRDYNLILFSDHGQVKSEPFTRAFGKSAFDVILETADSITKNPETNRQDIVFSPSHSIGNLYFNSMKDKADLSEIKEKYPSLVDRLLEHAGIEMIAGREGDTVIVHGKEGKITLDGDVEGKNPLAKYSDVAAAKDVAEQIKSYLQIPKTGDLVLFSSWQNPEKVYNFSEEAGGQHSGLGGPQSKPFILSNSEDPVDTSVILTAKDLHCQLKDIVAETRE